MFDLDRSHCQEAATLRALDNKMAAMDAIYKEYKHRLETAMNEGIGSRRNSQTDYAWVPDEDGIYRPPIFLREGTEKEKLFYANREFSTATIIDRFDRRIEIPVGMPFWESGTPKPKALITPADATSPPLLTFLRPTETRLGMYRRR